MLFLGSPISTPGLWKRDIHNRGATGRFDEIRPIHQHLDSD
jgi:hypothetical protein